MTTETLRPNGVGTTTQLTPTDSVSNWQNVDEVTPNEDTDRNFRGPSSYAQDTYATQNPTGSGTINSVTIYVRCKRNPYASTGYAKTAIRTDGTDYLGSEVSLTTSYANYSTVYNTNPKTGLAWTWDEITALEIGVALKGEAGYEASCTQVYVVVDYSEVSTYSKTFGIDGLFKKLDIPSSFAGDMILVQGRSISFASDKILVLRTGKPYASDLLLKRKGIQKTWGTDLIVRRTVAMLFFIDKLLKRLGISKPLPATMLLKMLGVSKSAAIDIVVKAILASSWGNDLLMQSRGLPRAFAANMYLQGPFEQRIGIDLILKGLDIPKSFPIGALVFARLEKPFAGDLILQAEVLKRWVIDELLRKPNLVHSWALGMKLVPYPYLKAPYTSIGEALERDMTGIALSRIQEGTALERIQTGKDLPNRPEWS